MSHFCVQFFFFSVSGDPLYLHVLTHSSPTRRSSDLPADRAAVYLARGNGLHVEKADLLGLVVCNRGALANWVEIEIAELLAVGRLGARHHRSEEHTSELQSLMRISYAVFCLKKKKKVITS